MTLRADEITSLAAFPHPAGGLCHYFRDGDHVEIVMADEIVPVVQGLDWQSIKRVQEGLSVETLDRAQLWRVQTPQVFDADLIRVATEKALSDGVLPTDDCAAVERLGMKVSITQGSKENIKITTPFDLMLGVTILEARGRGEL